MTFEEITAAVDAERRRREITYKEIGDRTGIEQHTVSRWMGRAGKGGIRLINAVDIAEAVGMELTVRRIDEPRPTLMTYAEMQMPYGFGFLEEDISDEDGEDYHLCGPCCWTWDGERIRIVTPGLGEYLQPHKARYNQPLGWRVWTGRPTDDQRAAAAWDGEGGEDDGEP